MLDIKKVSPALKVKVLEAVPAPAWSAATEKRIQAIWDREKKKRGERLFDAPMLSLERVDGETLWARRVSYRAYLGQLREPALYAELKIRALAVSGLLHVGDEVLFGLRATHLTQDPGCWELVPSGGLSLDYLGADGVYSLKDQFLAELREELGVAADALSGRALPYLLVEDTESHCIDLAIEARVKEPKESIAHAHESRGTDEYTALAFVAAPDLPRFEREHPIVPVSLALLKNSALFTVQESR